MSNKMLIPDKTAAYWWQMQMNPDQKVTTMTGYGKIEGHRENKSKIQNLMRIVTMLYSKGYFHRTFRIDIYERVGALACVEVDRIVLTITPAEIQYFGDDRDFQNFLNNFRLAVENGIAPKVHLRPLTDVYRKEVANGQAIGTLNR